MPSTGAAALRVRDHFLHDRAEARDRAGAQIVAVAESAGKNDHVRRPGGRDPCARGRRLLRRAMSTTALIGVVVAVGAGERDDSELHACCRRLDLEVFGHRIGEKLARTSRVTDFFRGVALSASVSIDDVSADVHVAHGVETRASAARPRLPCPADREARAAA